MISLHCFCLKQHIYYMLNLFFLGVSCVCGRGRVIKIMKSQSHSIAPLQKYGETHPTQNEFL